MCIYCSTQNDLNSQFTITLDDGKKVVVYICDAHAEEATIRTAKERYLNKQREIDDFMAKAKELGLEVSLPSQSGLVTTTTKPAPKPAVVAAAIIDDKDMIDTALIDRKDHGMVSVGGSAPAGQSIESHRSIDLTATRELLSEEVLRGKVKMELFEGRNGVPIAVPTKRVDQTGTTQIKLVPTNDQQLQKRFKEMADQSRSDRGWDSMHHFGKEGYSVTDCPICHGSGVARNAGAEITCPKCKGKGTL